MVNFRLILQEKFVDVGQNIEKKGCVRKAIL